MAEPTAPIPTGSRSANPRLRKLAHSGGKTLELRKNRDEVCPFILSHYFRNRDAGSR